MHVSAGTRPGPGSILKLAPLVVLLFALGVGGPAAGRADRSEKRVEGELSRPFSSYKDAIRETVYVQSTVDEDGDGELDLMATDIIRPRETENGLDVPVIYEDSPYYQALGRGNESEIKGEEDGDFKPEVFPLFYDNYFVPRGYAVVLQDMTGTRNSEGCMVLGGAAEVAAAKATIDWLNGRGTAFDAEGHEKKADWSTGKVGMIGKSYDGTIANATAATGIEGLETIVPIGAIGRWYDYHLNNGVQYPNAVGTPALFSFVIDQTPGDDEERGRDWAEATFGETSVCSATGAQIVAQAGDPGADYNAFWDERDYVKDVGKVQASVFVAHGLNDFNVKPNHFTQWWEGLARNGVPRKLWLAQTGHVDPFEFRRDRWVRTLHRWFDYWLMGIDNGIATEPMVDIERSADVWRTYRTWPLPGSRKVRLELGPKAEGRPGVLTRGNVKKGASQTYTDDPEQSEQEMASDRSEAKEGRLLFVSPKLRRATHLSGTAEVSIRATVDRSDTNFTALLVDYGRDRRVAHEASGEGIRTTDEESCHGQSTEQDDACYFAAQKVTAVAPFEIVSRGWLDARHRKSLRQGSQLEPGKPYRFRWEIFGEDYIFKPGHRIGIVIAGGDPDYTIPDQTRATVEVALDRSFVLLPIVGGSGRTGF